MDNRRLSTLIAIVVTAVWAASFIADIFIPGYNPSPFIHLAMMTVVGAIFGRNFVGSNGNNQPPPQPPPPPPPAQQPPGPGNTPIVVNTPNPPEVM